MVAESLQEKFAKVGLHMNSNKCQVIPRGQTSSQMRETFRKYKWIDDGNFELLGAPIGTAQYCCQKARDKVVGAEPLLQAISQLPQKQTALHLLRYCGTFSLITYLMRTTPQLFIHEVLAEFDEVVKAALGEIMGTEVPLHAWMQAQLSLAKGGLGLRSPVLHAPGAYLASTHQVVARASSLYPAFTEDTQWTRACRTALTKQIDPSIPLSLEGDMLTQKLVSLAVDRSLMHRIAGLSSVPPNWQAHLALVQLPTAGVWLTAPPVQESESYIEPVLFQTALRRRLRMPVQECQCLCPMCGEAMDVYGDHALVCQCSGDRNARHHHLRDILATAAEQGGLQPEREKQGLLPDHVGIEAPAAQLRRPADVYVPRGHNHKHTAYDMAVTSGLGQRTVHQVVKDPAAIFTHYEDIKSTYLDTLNQCKEVGVDFQPLIFEAHGGAMSPTTRLFLDYVSRTTTTVDHQSAPSVALRIA
eukprot:5103681-Amphidinium_carterae.1